MTEWIRVDERLPEPGVRVLISDGKTMAVASLDPRFSRPGEPWWDDEGITGADRDWVFTPTHWTLAPEPPK